MADLQKILLLSSSINNLYVSYSIHHASIWISKFTSCFFFYVFIRIVNSIYVLLFYLLFCMKLDFALTNVSKISKTILIVACFIIKWKHISNWYKGNLILLKYLFQVLYVFLNVSEINVIKYLWYQYEYY